MSLMSENDETSDDLGGSLADAIAAHLELKKEHGADPEELDREFETALSPANRDEDDSVDLHPASEDLPPEPLPETAKAEQPAAVEPDPAPSTTAVITPEPEAEPEPEPDPTPEPDLDSHPEAASEAEPAPAVEPEANAAAPATEHAPGEITGTIEFEWDKEAEEAAAEQSTAEAAEHDLLEDTPDFFEETPEHDKLWFDEAPPRKFDF